MAKILPFEEKTQCPPDNILRKVSGRPKNEDVRSREHLTLEEVQALMKAAGSMGQHQHTDDSGLSGTRINCTYSPIYRAFTA